MKWSENYGCCVKCGTTNHKSYGTKGLCVRCYKAEWGKNNYHKNIEKYREITKLWQRKKKRKEGKRMPIVDGLWSNKYDNCIQCGTKEKKHSVGGLCSICYDRKRWPEKHKRYLERLYSDNNFHKKELEKSREYSQRPEVKARMREYKQRPEIKAMIQKLYLKNRNKILKSMNKKYKERIKKLKKELPKRYCVECNNYIIDKKYYSPSEFFRFCSKECSQNNWRRKNEKHIKDSYKRYGIINSNKISERGKEYRKNNPLKKKKADRNWYDNNYPRIRMMSRIRQINMGKVPHNHNNFEEIMKRDIGYLKKRIEECGDILKGVDKK